MRYNSSGILADNFLMKETHSYADCYQMLGASPEQSFKEIRKNYKRNIQKSHPDRLEESQKEAANNKIKQLSSAFSVIEKHYKEHGSLPAIFTGATNTETTATSDFSTSPADNDENDTAHKKEKSADTQNSASIQQSSKNKSKSSKFFLFILVALVALIFFYLDNSFETEKPAIKEEIKIIKPIKNKTNIIENKNDLKDKKKKPEFFTLGSPIGEVIDVQGKPDKTIKDVWSYGTSKVIFKDGLVVDWKRGKGSPIKARLIISGSHELHPKENKKTLPSTFPK